MHFSSLLPYVLRCNPDILMVSCIDDIRLDLGRQLQLKLDTAVIKLNFYGSLQSVEESNPDILQIHSRLDPQSTSYDIISTARYRCIKNSATNSERALLSVGVYRHSCIPDVSILDSHRPARTLRYFSKNLMAEP